MPERKDHRNKAEKSAPVRMTLELSERQRERLEEVGAATDASFSNVIRRAVDLYKILIDETRAGSHVVIRAKDGTEREVLILEATE
jgi:hypothetical protein